MRYLHEPWMKPCRMLENPCNPERTWGKGSFTRGLYEVPGADRQAGNVSHVRNFGIFWYDAGYKGGTSGACVLLPEQREVKQCHTLP